MQLLVLIAWFAFFVSLTAYTGGVALTTQTTMISSYAPTFFYRSAASIGAILMILYADRWPLNRAINFGSFTVNTLILFSWFADGGLYETYQGRIKYAFQLIFLYIYIIHYSEHSII